MGLFWPVLYWDLTSHTAVTLKGLWTPDLASLHHSEVAPLPHAEAAPLPSHAIPQTAKGPTQRPQAF